MPSRRQAREQALQLLYQVDLAETGAENAIQLFWRSEPGDPDNVAFATKLVRGTQERLEEIDAAITEASINWKIARMSHVDRNILRMAVYEFLACDDIPPMVSMNEAIELGKRFGTTDSGSFINGILDRVARNLNLTSGQRAR